MLALLLQDCAWVKEGSKVHPHYLLLPSIRARGGVWI